MAGRESSTFTSRAVRLLLGVLLTVILTVGICGVAFGERPAKHMLKGVPQITQMDGWGCGAASMQMMMGYWGPRIDQRAVVNVIRSTGRGSSLMDAARAGQFSKLSFAAAAYNYPAVLCCSKTGGYNERKLGYGAFFHAAEQAWFEELKDIVAQGYPVQVLTDWLPDEYGPHYRVIVGYDDTRSLIYLTEPYPYGGWLDMYKQPGFYGSVWPYEDFLAVWALPTDRWGIEGLKYGAVIAAPWKVSVSMPRSVKKGAGVTARIKVTYRCPAPFGQGPEATFPTFPAAEAKVKLGLPAGWKTVGGADEVQLNGGTLLAGQSKTVRVKLKIGKRSGLRKLKVVASGKVGGSVPEWGTMGWKDPYDYTDLIGGRTTVKVRVR